MLKPPSQLRTSNFPLTLAAPLLPPARLTLVCEGVTLSAAAGPPMVKLCVVVQLLASVTVTV